MLKVFDNGMYTGMILIDLLKAFDTINYKILPDKLLPTGFSKNMISWYESYLAERHFTVEVANRVSKFTNISCGKIKLTYILLMFSVVTSSKLIIFLFFFFMDYFFICSICICFYCID